MIYHGKQEHKKQSWHKLFYAASIMVFACLQTTYTWAGAWVLPKGQGQVIQTTLYSNANMGFDKTGQLSQSVQFAKFNSNVYWEHGLLNNTTFIASTNIQDLNYTSGVDTVDFQGIGQTNIGIKQKIWGKGNLVISLQPSVFFAGSGETVSDAILGAGGEQYEIRLLAGKNFKLARKDGFIDIQSAWRFRLDGLPDERRFDVTIGWRPRKKYQILAQTFYVHANESPQRNLSRRTKALKAQASLVYDKTANISYQIGTYQTIRGQETIKEKAFFIAIWKRY